MVMHWPMARSFRLIAGFAPRLPTSAWLLTDTSITGYPIEFYYPIAASSGALGIAQRRLLFVPRGVFRTLVHPEKSVFP